MHDILDKQHLTDPIKGKALRASLAKIKATFKDEDDGPYMSLDPEIRDTRR